MGVFRLDSKFMQVMGKVADLMIVNILTLLCCLPVITIGASITAMYSVLLKIFRNEDGSICKQFFKAFRDNFKQSTVIMLIYSVLAVLLVTDFFVIIKGTVQLPLFLRYLLLGITLLIFVSYTWVFILQSRYDNKISFTICNSFVVGISMLLYTGMMILFDILPFLLLYYFEGALLLVMLFGFTIPGFLKIILCSKVFAKLESIDCNNDTSEAIENNT